MTNLIDISITKHKAAAAAFEQAMSHPKDGHVIAMQVIRDGDDHGLLWQFREIGEARIALEYVIQNMATVEVTYQPFNPHALCEIAEEFRVWLTLEYLVEEA